VKSARTAARALTASALAAMVVLTGCSAAKTGEPAPQSSGGDHELHLPADYSGEGPGTLRSSSSWTRHVGCAAIQVPISSSTSVTRRSNQRMCRRSSRSS